MLVWSRFLMRYVETRGPKTCTKPSWLHQDWHYEQKNWLMETAKQLSKAYNLGFSQRSLWRALYLLGYNAVYSTGSQSKFRRNMSPLSSGLQSTVLLATCFTLVYSLAYSSTLKKKATCTSETPIDFQRITRRYISVDGTFQVSEAHVVSLAHFRNLKACTEH
jgi:hypothetical protein